MDVNMDTEYFGMPLKLWLLFLVVAVFLAHYNRMLPGQAAPKPPMPAYYY